MNSLYKFQRINWTSFINLNIINWTPFINLNGLRFSTLAELDAAAEARGSTSVGPLQPNVSGKGQVHIVVERFRMDDRKAQVKLLTELPL